jgi:hypothetical protein
MGAGADRFASEGKGLRGELPYFSRMRIVFLSYVHWLAKGKALTASAEAGDRVAHPETA